MQKKMILAASLAALFSFSGTSLAAVVCYVGEKAEVEWKGKWYNAKVLKTSDDKSKCFVQYDGYGPEWNEWVGEDRIKVTYKVGDKLQVKWKGNWYPANVLEVKGGKYKIRYDGYDSSWDEWIDLDRIKPK